MMLTSGNHPNHRLFSSIFTRCFIDLESKNYRFDRGQNELPFVPDFVKNYTFTYSGCIHDG